MKFLTLFLLLNINTQAIASNACNNNLNQQDHTEQFIEYLAKLYNEQVLNHKDLELIARNLEKQNKLINPLFEHSQESSKHYLHSQNLQVYAESSNVNLDSVLQWIKNELLQTGKLIQHHMQVQSKTREKNIEIIFHPLQLHYDFEVMATKVTQKMWVDLMGDNPSKFKEGNTQRIVIIGNKTITMLPNNPVENITWWSAAIFANRLSKQKGLIEVYDFSAIQNWNGDATQGTLYPEDIKSALKLLKIKAPEGDVTRADGYRLPTIAEGDMLYSESPGIDVTKLTHYEWFKENSSDKTQPVADLLPIQINGYDFYDIYGNLMEMSHDWGPSAAPSTMYTRGGFYSQGSHKRSIKSLRTTTLMYEYKNDIMGFRLVRSLPK